MQKLKETRKLNFPASKQQIILKFDSMKVEPQKQQQAVVNPSPKAEDKHHLQITVEQIDTLIQWLSSCVCKETETNAEMLKLCQQVAKNYRKCVNQQQISVNKTLRFRIAKSAKKISNRTMAKAQSNSDQIKLYGQTLQGQKQNICINKNIDVLIEKQRKAMRSTLSTLPSNSSTDQLRLLRKDSKEQDLIYKDLSDLKVKIDYGINTDIFEQNEQKQKFTDTINQLQTKLEQVISNYQRQCMMNTQINLQLQKLKQQQVQIKNNSLSPIPDCSIPFRIDLECSLKMIENAIKIQPTTKSKELFPEASRMLRENIEHLQMMIISQSKQIQDLQTRVSSTSTSTKQSQFLAKASRWNAY